MNWQFAYRTKEDHALSQGWIFLGTNGVGISERARKLHGTPVPTSKGNDGASRAPEGGVRLVMRADTVEPLRQELHKFIAEDMIEMHYQPIWRLGDASILGYEALARGPVRSKWRSPAALFKAAATAGMLPELEYHLRRKALSHFDWGGQHGLLFLNIHPAVPVELEPSERRCVVGEMAVKRPHALIVEFPEEDLVQRYPDTIATAHGLRALGASICLDDFGSGFAGLQSLVALRPNWIKLDRSFVSGIGTSMDGWRSSIVRHLVSLCHELAVKVVAEGIETPSELEAVAELGVFAAQGYLLGKPSPALRHRRPVVIGPT